MKIPINREPSILTSSDDDFLYHRLLQLLKQIKLVRGANELAFTLRNHPKIRNYLVSKQIERINSLEEMYFLDDGSLNFEQVKLVLQRDAFAKAKCGV